MLSLAQTRSSRHGNSILEQPGPAEALKQVLFRLQAVEAELQQQKASVCPAVEIPEQQVRVQAAQGPTQGPAQGGPQLVLKCACFPTAGSRSRARTTARRPVAAEVTSAAPQGPKVLPSSRVLLSFEQRLFEMNTISEMSCSNRRFRPQSSAPSDKPEGSGGRTQDEG